MLADVRYALRAMRRSPGFYGLLLAILALGIGVSVSVFSLIDGVVLRPLPYRDPARLIALESVATKPPFESNGSFTYDDFTQIRAARSFEDVAVMYRDGWSRMELTEGGERVHCGFVSPDFFDLFGRSPVFGRVFSATENGDRVLVLSERLATRRFGSAGAALGRDLEMAGLKWRIIGVMANDFRVPFLDTEMWAPIESHPQWNDRQEPNSRSGAMRWDLLARLRPGVSIAAARAELDSIYGSLRRAAPDSHTDAARVVPLREHFTRQVRGPFAILSAAVGLLLLIACANAANLLLGRAAMRAREFSIRAALGAGFGRLLRQTMAETIVLCAVGGAIGAALSVAMVRVLKAVAPAGTPRLDEVAVDSRVLLFAIALSAATGIGLGIASASRNFRPRKRKLKNLLVAAEFAIAMVLVTSSALLLRSFVAVMDVSIGFAAEHVLTARVELPDGMTAPRRTGFFKQVIERIREIPGVVSVGATDTVFQLGLERTHALRLVEGQAPEPVAKWQPLEWSTVAGDYFQTLGIPLLRGRYFDQRDGPDAPPAVIVNETLARRYWPGENAVGKRVKGFDARGKNDDWLTVVGVVKDVRSAGRERQPFSQVYEAQAQSGVNPTSFVIRTARDPASVSAAVRAAIREINGSVSVASVETMQQVIDSQESSRRFETWLIGAFSSAALLLAALGVFAVMHFAVAARTREIGIRMAVGARPANILSLVIGDGTRLAAVGIGAGLLGSVWSADAISGLLFGVRPIDPVSFSAGVLILIFVALAACVIPARRAASLNPVAALRNDA
ncbi:MAG TPA: ABC transporter permease [Bryobacteraceae bacterium]|nr:ABC transporter permease [Bryobacteraceae bacterium]